MLKNKSILLPKTETDGLRICLMNSIHPEYLFDLWLPCLAPSRELVEKYVINNLISWEEFSRLYRNEQQTKDNFAILKSLIDLIKTAAEKQKNVTFLCFEEEIFHCHRKIIIEEMLKLDPALAAYLDS